MLFQIPKEADKVMRQQCLVLSTMLADEEVILVSTQGRFDRLRSKSDRYG